MQDLSWCGRAWWQPGRWRGPQASAACCAPRPQTGGGAPGPACGPCGALRALEAHQWEDPRHLKPGQRPWQATARACLGAARAPRSRPRCACRGVPPPIPAGPRAQQSHASALCAAPDPTHLRARPMTRAVSRARPRRRPQARRRPGSPQLAPRAPRAALQLPLPAPAPRRGVHTAACAGARAPAPGPTGRRALAPHASSARQGPGCPAWAPPKAAPAPRLAQQAPPPAAAQPPTPALGSGACLPRA
jgi:hypothetical protein